MIEVASCPAATSAYGNWNLGFLEMDGLGGNAETEALGEEALRIGSRLKEKIGGMSRKEVAGRSPIADYAAHYARWGLAYPVMIQAMGVASKGRHIAMPTPLVTAMFAAELEGLLLIAGHDIGALEGTLSLGLACGAEDIPTLGGATKPLPEGDLFMRDDRGIIASLLLGPDARTALSADTKRALFVVYAPESVATEEVRGQLERIAKLVAIAHPQSTAERTRVQRIASINS